MQYSVDTIFQSIENKHNLTLFDFKDKIAVGTEIHTSCHVTGER
jgi:hypothetical protein